MPFQKGQKVWNKGLKGYTNNGSFKKNHSDLVSSEARKKAAIKISKNLMGRKLSDNHRKNLSKSHKGYKMPESQKKKISKANKGKPKYSIRGINHPNWNNGSSFEPYSVDWTETLRKSIRERDRYTCQICRKEPVINCHHIDYDKKNCNVNNLVVLCASCHTKTNHNRNYWINYFNKFISNMI